MTKPPKPRGKRAHLTDDDHELWSYTARTVAPLPKVKPRVPDVSAEDVAPTTEARHKRHAAEAAGTKKLREHDTSPPAPARPRPAPEPAQFDTKAARKLRAGREEIEARIDLHGLRQRDAHAALRRFLLAAHARGLRFVLVITGKGAAGTSRWDAHAGLDREERGVIRRNVPLWLAEPGLCAIVVSHTAAAPRHGGDGALYVHLRNPERVR